MSILSKQVEKTVTTGTTNSMNPTLSDLWTKSNGLLVLIASLAIGTVAGTVLYFVKASAFIEMRLLSVLFAVLTSIACILAMVVLQQHKKLVRQSERLQMLANTDPLTKCHNRRSLLNSADEIHQRYGAAGGLLMVDVDHFKVVNDTHGHDIGDQVLVHISNIVRANIRTDDILARMGSEEFVVYLPGCDKIQSVRIANRICYSVAQQPLTTAEEKIPVTVSVGLVQMRSTKENIFLQWLGAADRLLYKAKSLGRNQVCYIPQAHIPCARLGTR